jgi:hypothetical protein
MLVDEGWHTEVLVPEPEPGAGWTSWGFGARDFITAARPGLGEFLRALTPGPAAIVATPREPRPGAVALPVGATGLATIRRFLAGELERDGEGMPLAIEPGFAAPGRFYAARRLYSLAYTCNSWTMDVLAAGGIPVRSRGTLTAADAMAEARRAAMTR